MLKSQETKSKNNKKESEETHPPAKAQPSFLQTTPHLKPNNPNDSTHLDKKGRTKITIKYDVGFPNQLYIRGKGANLSWEKGIPLKNIKADEWIWESDANFLNCEFKVLVNDKHYEKGENHLVASGSTIIYTPHF